MGNIKLEPIEIIYKDRVVLPDATVVNTYKPPQKSVEKLVEERKAEARAREQEQRIRRTLYKDRKKALQKRKYQNNTQSQKVEIPIELLPDAIIDREIEKEKDMANQPLIYSTNPVWFNYTPEARRDLGYFTNEERDLAARLNDVRSNTILGSVMPNFGRQFAYYNPGAEMDAFRLTALYMPNAILAGSSFGLPSATLATITGAKAGWQTAGNLAKRTFSAGTQAVKSAAPVVTNPRWAATTAAFTVPAVAQASSSGDYTSLGFGIGIPLAIGAGAYLAKGKLRGKKTPTTDTTPSAQYLYKSDKRLFTWEHPTTWARRQRLAFRDKKLAGIIDEWNAAIGDPAKELAFINKYNIREMEETPQWIEKQVTEPKTYKAVKIETVQEPAMEDVPSSIIGTDGKPLIIQRPKLNADGSPVMQSVEREAKDAYGNPVLYDKPILDDLGQPVMETFTRREPKLGEDGQQIVIHNPISRDLVPLFLEGKLRDYTSNILDANNVVFIGPTGSQQFRMRARNLGRIGTWLGVTGATGLIGYHLFKPSRTTLSNNSDKKDSSDSTKVATPDSVRTIKYIDVTPDGRIITQKFDGTGYDTIAPKEYLTPKFDD